MPSRRRAGFTLIELLTVISIIGILAAMIFPAISGVRKQARHADAQTAFSQWATGVTRYKQVYGYFPNIGASYDTTQDTLHYMEDPSTNLKFVKALSGRSPTGLALSTTDRKALNKNAEEFCAFGKNDFEDFANFNDNSLLVDRFNNRHIRIIFDTDSTGTIKNINVGAGSDSIPPDIQAISTSTGLPARVVIYTTDLGMDFESFDGLGASDFDKVIAIQ
jgi:prepilin-type N-terminal cleavage/methylation domain-containing protein